jgi:hypothetical protein
MKDLQTGRSCGVTPMLIPEEHVNVAFKGVPVHCVFTESDNACTPVLTPESVLNVSEKTKLRGLGPRVNYTEQATAACRRS